MDQDQCELEFHGILRDFLDADKVEQTYHFSRPPSLKDVIESRGVPHPEVRLILENGKPAPFERLVLPQARYDIYPAHCHPEVAETDKLPFIPAAGPRFILDVHLGVLARSMRMLGFDCSYTQMDPGDARIAEMAHEEERIALSRDLGLLKRAAVTYGRWVRNRDPKLQLEEIIDHYQLRSFINPFTRCMNCNLELDPVEKADILPRLPERVRDAYDEFRHCHHCDQYFWKGTHYQSMIKIIENFT